MESPTRSVQVPPVKEEISYPATRMMSIADLLEMNLLEPTQTRSFKTPAERKEMPPLPVDYSFNAAEPAPNAILPTQYNFANPNFTAPNIQYHMNNMAPPFYDMHYYAGPPISYGGLTQMNFNNGGPPINSYNPPIDPAGTVAKGSNFPVVVEGDKAPPVKEKKRNANVKRAGKFHPYQN